MRRITPVLLAAGAAALIAVSGCGSQAAAPLGNVSLSAAEALQQSVQKSQAVDSYAADIVVDVTDPAGATGKVQGSMVFQQKPDLAADVTFDQLTFGGQSVPGGMRAILTGETLYLKLDALRTLAGSTKPWVKVDLNALDGAGGVNVQELLAQARQYDLESSVKMLTASKDAKVVGTETVGGAETTHYTGTFSVEEAAKQLTPELQQKLRGDLAQVKDMKFDAWIDAQGLPRKITMNGQADKGSFVMTLLFKSFNQAADISAPPADQVGELPKNIDGGGN